MLTIPLIAQTNIYINIIFVLLNKSTIIQHSQQIFIDGIVNKIKDANVGCYVSTVCVSILIYADDILLIAPSVSGLQTLVNICETELMNVDMSINVKKSVCIRVDPQVKLNV